MKCEYCNNEHNGEYGSGRFCDSRCARGFSTREKRKNINEKVSKKLKGRKVGGCGTFTDEQRKKGGINSSIKYFEKQLKTPFELLSEKGKRKIILFEQNYCCDICGIKNEWNGKLLVFHLDHINGKKENIRKNLRMLCPNCHSQTDTYCSRNISDESREKNRKLMLEICRKKYGKFDKTIKI
mgnify:CR=1 FL=1